MTTRPTAAAIDETAAAWAARVDARPLQEGEQAELDAWLAGDPRCLGAYARALALLAGAAPLCRLADRPRVSPPVTRRALLWSGGGAIAASLAVAAVTLRRPPAPARNFESALGEIRHITLDDGSRLTLNTNSAVSAEFGHDRRLIRMLRGEAFFEVVKDPARPFLVAGPFAVVRTVGTAYGVNLHDAETMKVEVASGRVAIESPPSRLVEALQSVTGGWPQGGDASPPLVDAGHTATIRLPATSRTIMVDIEPVDAQALTRSLAWRDGQLAFEGTSLPEAAAEFARYSRRRLVVAPELAHRHVSGLFAADDVDGFARAAALSLGARVRMDDDTIVLSR